MPIAVFDIDGTLTDTLHVDIECYETAIRAELGLEIPSDWSTFDEVTDTAILATACERQGVPVPEPAVEERIALLVAQLLAEAFLETPERFRPIPGATEVFGRLEEAGWKVAMATGAWRPSALVKLDGAGIPHDGVPLASSSDHPARAEIIRHAVRAASSDPSPVFYVGDGVWDGRAAGSLGYSFVGVARGPRCDELRGVGAVAVFPDFSDGGAFVEHLDRIASEPRYPASSQ